MGLIHKKCAETRRRAFHARNQGRILKAGEFVKLQITDGQEAEYLWFEVMLALDGDVYLGRCDNEAVLVKSVMYDQVIRFVFDEVEEVYQNKEN